MERTPIEGSSNLKSAGYDPSTQTLEVEFNAGTYQYFRVPEEVYAGLLKSESKGRFLRTEVQGFYNYERVE